MATVYDSGDGESLFTRKRQRRRRNLVTFAYDTSVNLLANLLAAAIIYLVAQAAGAIEPNSDLTKAAIIVIVGITGMALLIYLDSRKTATSSSWQPRIAVVHALISLILVIALYRVDRLLTTWVVSYTGLRKPSWIEISILGFGCLCVVAAPLALARHYAPKWFRPLLAMVFTSLLLALLLAFVNRDLLPDQ